MGRYYIWEAYWDGTYIYSLIVNLLIIMLLVSLIQAMTWIDNRLFYDGDE